MSGGTPADLWAKTHPALDLAKADPQATYKPVAAISALDTLKAGPGPGPGSAAGTGTEPATQASRRVGFAKAQGAPVYELIEEIGRGGMGVVYRARQGSLGREVAVKKSLASAAVEARRRDPFVAEALTTGLLDHPNIVPVHDLGTTPEGEVFLAMKLLSGAPWSAILHPASEAERTRAAAFDLQRNLEVLLDVGNAVAFAHSKGIVHNDLKPSNIMVGDFGEVVVMDWGVAVDTREAAPGPAAGATVTATASGTFHKSAIRTPCGTPAYMPPELAEGRGEDIGPPTDVYLLGAILHEVLTGRPPHVGKSFVEVLAAAIESASPSFGAAVPDELAAIARRALARAPHDRYPTVAAFQEALRGFLRHRESLAIADAARAALAGCERAGGFKGPPTPAMEVARSRQSRDSATARESVAGARKYGVYAELSEAIAGFRQALVLWPQNPGAAEGLRTAHLRYAGTALAYGDLGLAEAHAEAVQPRDDDAAAGGVASAGAGAEARSLRAAIAQAFADRDRARRAARRIKVALVIALLAAVSTLAAGFVLVRAERDRAERSAEEAKSQAERADRERLAAERGLAETLLAQGHALTASGRRAAAERSFDRAVEVLARLGSPSLPADVGRFALERRWPAPVRTIDLPGAAAAPGPAGPATAVAFLPPPGGLFAAGQGGEVWTILDPRAAAPTRAHFPASGALLSLTPDGRRLAVAGPDGGVAIVDLPARRRLRVVAASAAPPSPATALAIAPDGRTILVGRHHGAIEAWNLADANPEAPPRTFAGHEGPVLALALDATGEFALSGGADGTVRRWHVESAHQTDVLEGHAGPVNAVLFAQNPRIGLSASDDRTIRVWDFRTGRPLREIRGHDGAVTCLALTPDSVHVVSGSRDETVRVFHIDSGTERRALAADAPVRAVAVSAEGDLAAAAGEDGRVRLLDLTAALGPGEPGRVVRRLARTPPAAEPEREGGAAPPAGGAVAVSADGLLALAAASNGALALFDLATGRELRQISAHRVTVTSVAFLPAEGSPAPAASVHPYLVLAASADGEIKLIDPLARQPVLASAAHPGAGPGAIVVPLADGRALSGGDDGTVRFHDLRAEREVAVVARHTGGVTGLAASADGRLAASTGRDGALQRIDLPPADGASPAAPRARTIFAAGAGNAGPIAISPDRAWALLGGPRGVLRLVDLTGTGEPAPPRLLRGHTDDITAVAFTADGRFARSAAADGTWRLWSLSGGEELHAFAVAPPPGAAPTSDPEPAPPPAPVLPPRPPPPAPGTTPPGGRPPPPFLPPPALPPAPGPAARPARIAGLAAAADDRLVLAGLDDGSLLAFDLRGRSRPVDAPALAEVRRSWAEGHLLAAHHALVGLPAAAAATLPPAYLALCRQAIAAEEERQGSRIARELDIVHAVAFSPDGAHVLSAAADGSVHLRSVADGRLARAFTGLRGAYAASFSRDGRRVAAGGKEGAVKVWDAGTGAELRTIALSSGSVSALAFSPDGRRILVAAEAGLVDAEVESDAVPRTIVAHEGGVRRVALAPDGRHAVTFGRDGKLKLLDLDTAREVRTFDGDTSGLSSLALSADGRLAVTGGSDWAVRVFEVVPGRQLRVLKGHGFGVYAVAVSPVAARAASAGSDGRTIVWDLATGAQVRAFEGSGGAVLTVAFSPDGLLLATGENNGTVTVRSVDGLR